MIERLFGEVNGIFNRITLLEILISIVYILTGLIFYTNSNISDSVVSIVVGLLLIGNGITSIYNYFKRGGIVLYNNNLIYGIIIIITGILAILLGNVLSTILGIYVLVLGIQRINYALFLKKFKESSWLLTIVVGVLFLIIAIISLFTSSKSLIVFSGLCLMGYGLINIVNVLLLRKRSKYFIA